MYREMRVKRMIEQIRKQCLNKGVGALKELAVVFRHMDDDFSQRLCFQELERGMKSIGVKVDKEDLHLLFDTFDRNKNNQIDFVELVSTLRPPISKARAYVVKEAFKRLDFNADGVISIEDLKIVYSSNAKRHPKYVSGEWTEEQVLRHFLDSIDTPDNSDGKVTREEFMNYYAGVSATVDDDSYFDLMMRACYDLPNKGEAKK